MRHERAKRSECAHAVRQGVDEAMRNTYMWGDDFIPRPQQNFKNYFHFKKVHFTDSEDPGSKKVQIPAVAQDFSNPRRVHKIFLQVEAMRNTYMWGDDFIPRPPTGFLKLFLF